jgi:hypothetical protein
MKMKKKISEHERFMALSDAEKDREVAKYDREIPLPETSPLTPADRARLRRARKRGRPRIGAGSKRIQVTLERGLLKQVDRYARQHRMSRAELLALGAKTILSGAA